MTRRLLMAAGLAVVGCALLAAGVVIEAAVAYTKAPR